LFDRNNRRSKPSCLRSNVTSVLKINECACSICWYHFNRFTKSWGFAETFENSGLFVGG